MFVTEGEGRTRLNGYLDRTAEAISLAEGLLSSRDFSTFRRMLSARGLANNRCDFVVHHVKQAFDSDPLVQFKRIAGREVMYISDIAIVVFKKLDHNLRTRNIPTQLVMKLFGQVPLPMMPEETPRFVAGWQMDRLNTAVQALWVTHPNGAGVAWAIPMRDENAGTNIVHIRPTTPSVPDSGVPQKLVRSKAEIARETEREHEQREQEGTDKS
ncbi:MAG: hypothetical protein HY874_07640 [Chloroflexi bacterium]|nr:hypothetical protein [Chloroflexota bacterium]